MDSRNFRPTACWENLQLRASLLHAVREFFEERGFLEVETPLLSADTVVDRHLEPFWVENVSAGSKAPKGQLPRRLWLQTSPEFAMKRLLVAGFEAKAPQAIYQITRAFRRDECGPLHNPEFTIVEWYRVGDGMREGMLLLSDLADAILACGPSEPLSYREAFERYVGVNPHAADCAEFERTARAKGIEPPVGLDARDRDGWLDLLLVECVQPHLGRRDSGLRRPAILFDYPAGQAALARLRDDENDGPVAERFELYVDGVELANGYHELTDADELRRRNAEVNHRREADGRAKLPEQNRLLAAMDAGLPSSTGVALGFDRLVMLAAGSRNIAEVMSFPLDRA